MRVLEFDDGREKQPEGAGQPAPAGDGLIARSTQNSWRAFGVNINAVIGAQRLVAATAETKAFLTSRCTAHRTKAGCRAEATASARDPMGCMFGFEAAARPNLMIDQPLLKKSFSPLPGVMSYVSMPFAANGFHLRSFS